RTRQAIKPFKWEDWCQSMELEYRPHAVPPIWPRPPALGRVGRLRRWARLRLIARALRHVAKHEEPLLSRDGVLESRVCELEARLARLKACEIPAARRGAAAPV